MASRGIKSTVFNGDSCLGEAEAFPTVKSPGFQFPNNEIRIHNISRPSKRCPPLSILHVISPLDVRCKLESESPLLKSVHASCIEEHKTAIVLLGDEEVHLVAMQSRQDKYVGFWCCAVPSGHYESCKQMLDTQSIAVVLNLEKTLVVPNTKQSIEEALQLIEGIIKLKNGVDAEDLLVAKKQYSKDLAILNHYLETNHVDVDGKLIGPHCEEVPRVGSNQEPIFRPTVRLPDNDIIITQMDPEVPGTNVFVRLHRHWEDLKRFLTIGKPRRALFEVFVCTMIEKDKALEIWWVLDPEQKLISSEQLLDRVVCVPQGSKKSLSTVFKSGTCSPKMAMVVDDCKDVWEDMDIPRVFNVTPYDPYFLPEPEMVDNHSTLKEARNYAYLVKDKFFKEFYDKLLPRISKACYEDDVLALPLPPDVGNFLNPKGT